MDSWSGESLIREWLAVALVLTAGAAPDEFLGPDEKSSLGDVGRGKGRINDMQ